MKKIVLIIGIILVVVVATIVFVKVGNKKEGLVGKWEYSSFVYTFNKDKTGTYDSLGTEMEFTYEDDGSTVSILYNGNTSPLELKYTIEGDKLIITDSFGTDVEYTKK